MGKASQQTDRDPNALEFTEDDLVDLSDLEKEEPQPLSRRISDWSEEADSDGKQADDQDKVAGTKSQERKGGKMARMLGKVGEFAAFALEFAKAIAK